MASHRDVQARAERSLVDQANILAVPKLVAIFCALSLGLLAGLLDQNGADTSSLIANTTFPMQDGRLSDIFGRKDVFPGAIFLVLANEICRDDDQLRSVTLYAMMYGSSVTNAWFNIALFPVTDVPNFVKGFSASLATCLLSQPVALRIHKRYQHREREIAAAAAITSVAGSTGEDSADTASDKMMPDAKTDNVVVMPELK
ncbi:hypothetical protein SCUCBS95973_004451 [Sporothrix curviconia]|uniref:Uncharacterized protein n=1 Tax=Sporothrix curviconia TaxID=1260050 RepID=A0ABP0BP55_9PEZI